MTLRRLQQAAAAARWLALAASAAFALSFVAIALLRIRYPFELEWMEGGLVDHVRRALAGQPIFVEPSIDFIAFLYPPLYYYVAALPAAIFGTDFFALRLLSFSSCLGASFLLYRFVQRETGARDVAAVSAALFLATFDRSGGWFDLARIDSFFLLLLMSGLFLVRFAESKRQLFAAGVLLAGATLVKQSTLVIVAPLMLYSAIVDMRRAAHWIGTLGVTVAASWLVLDIIHDGWFSFYCLTLPRNHPVESTRIMEFWTEDFTGPMKIACAFALCYLLTTTDSDNRQRRLFYAALAVGMIGASWSVRTVAGAWHNNLIPAFAATSILAGLGLHRILTWAEAGESASDPPERARRRASAVAIVAWLGVAAQFAFLYYDPREHLPSELDRQTGERTVERLRSVEGEVYLPHHGYLARRAGKRAAFAHALAIDNLAIEDPDGYGERVRQEVVAALRERRFAAVTLESDGWYHAAIMANYEAEPPRLFPEPNAFWPVTGNRLRPELLFLRVDGASVDTDED